MNEGFEQDLQNSFIQVFAEWYNSRCYPTERTKFTERDLMNFFEYINKKHDSELLLKANKIKDFNAQRVQELKEKLERMDKMESDENTNFKLGKRSAIMTTLKWIDELFGVEE